MYVLVQVNGAVVRAMVDTGATKCCLSSTIPAAVGLAVEPYASVVVPLNGEQHRVDGMARAVPLRMGDWTGHYDFMVMYLGDFELVLDMDFIMGAKLGILPYLGSLAFLEFGTPYIVNTVPIEEEPNSDLTRMVPASDIIDVQPEGSNNQGVGDQVSHGLGKVDMNDSWQGVEAKSESTRTSTSFGGDGFVTPHSCDSM